MLGPITDGDAERVGAFLNQHLNQRITPQGWAEALLPSWQVDAPNHGFMLVADGEVVGAQLGLLFRTAHGKWGRADLQSCRLLRARGLSQPEPAGCSRQCCRSAPIASPTCRPAAMSDRSICGLGFRKLDTATALVFNLPWPSWAGGTQLITDPKTIAATLTGRGPRYLSRSSGRPGGPSSGGDPRRRALLRDLQERPAQGPSPVRHPAACGQSGAFQAGSATASSAIC